MGIRLSVMRVNTNKSHCSQVAWRKQGGSCCPINLIISLLPKRPGRFPERATRAAQCVGIEHPCSAAPNLQLPFLLLFDLRFSYNSQSQMPLLTGNARGVISINGRTLSLFQYTFLSEYNEIKLDNTNTKSKKSTEFCQYHYYTVHTVYYFTIFALSHECLADVKSSSYTNLCIIPHKELRQSSEALSDASIKTILFSFHSLML